MRKEERTPESASKRTTRSTVASPAPKPSKPPSISDCLLFPDDPISLDTLLSGLPGRKNQIFDVLRLIGPVNSPMLPILVYGGASTGKTASVLRIFRHLRRHFVYASCRTCYCPRILFDSVLNQLSLHRRSEENGYTNAKKCERASDFVNLLRDALVRAINLIGAGSKERTRVGDGEMIYLVFDNLEAIRSWDKSTSVLSLLLRLHDLLRMPEVGLVYISSATPDAYYGCTGSIEPVPVNFPGYNVNEVFDILMLNQANPKLYSTFLSAVLKSFYRVTRRVDELWIALNPLFKKYCEPLSDLNSVPDEGMKRRLFNSIQPHITAALNEVVEIPSYASHEKNKEGSGSRRGTMRRLSGKEAISDLDFHMSVSAKYLLVSAFLASRNPATLDAALFDSTGGSDNRKRKRRSSQMSIEKNDSVVEDILIKGPGSFPLERLLAIYQCITSVVEGEFNEQQPEDGVTMEGGKIGLMSDVLLQLSTLCNANFIVRSGSCPLEGSTRFRSTIDEDLALMVARSINFPLAKYLCRR
ncbi:origin of replication complex subunit 5 [Dioscorea cayenensis subsp. rotundata]|uniref:Origin of replication complex subunit 5 n=1 Tax=Dioscorea cayennensis subsp. rotundata TaxID=55577 RepID=A0AB40CID3_DIOCR|nr:origin of replication complex subunit 5 [Dioscorea cayenensis subsp. rotundata]